MENSYQVWIILSIFSIPSCQNSSRIFQLSKPKPISVKEKFLTLHIASFVARILVLTISTKRKTKSLQKALPLNNFCFTADAKVENLSELPF